MALVTKARTEKGGGQSPPPFSVLTCMDTAISYVPGICPIVIVLLVVAKPLGLLPLVLAAGASRQRLYSL